MTIRADRKASTAPTPHRPGAAALFVGSFVDPLAPLDPPLPEIAFLGRSNVGKSSLLNALVGIKGLAKVSATPGKTQAMNVFRIGSPEPRAKSQEAHDASRLSAPGSRPYYLIDLPGYGYAKASKTDRARFAQLVEGFLLSRPSVTGVVWLLDIRHEPSQEDRTMAELLGERGLPALAVLTKADKLGTAAIRTQASMICRALGLVAEQATVTSAKNGTGLDELRATVAAAVSGQEE